MPVGNLIRDTAFGQIVRLATRNRVFQYPEEQDSEHWKNYLNEEKSGNIAQHGTTEPPENEPQDTSQNATEMHTRDEQANNGGESRDSMYTDVTYNEASGVQIDQEKGRDKNVIDWYGPNDPEVRACGRRPKSTTMLKLDRIQGTGPRQRSFLSPVKSFS